MYVLTSGGYSCCLFQSVTWSRAPWLVAWRFISGVSSTPLEPVKGRSRFALLQEARQVAARGCQAIGWAGGQCQIKDNTVQTTRQPLLQGGGSSTPPAHGPKRPGLGSPSLAPSCDSHHTIGTNPLVCEPVPRCIFVVVLLLGAERSATALVGPCSSQESRTLGRYKAPLLHTRLTSLEPLGTTALVLCKCSPTACCDCRQKSMRQSLKREPTSRGLKIWRSERCSRAACLAGMHCTQTVARSCISGITAPGQLAMSRSETTLHVGRPLQWQQHGQIVRQAR